MTKQKEKEVKESNKNLKDYEEPSYWKTICACVLIIAILVIGYLSYKKIYDKNKTIIPAITYTADEKRFKKEYESLNGKVNINDEILKDVDIAEDNNVYLWTFLSTGKDKYKISTVLKILTIISIVVLLAHTLTVEYEGFEFNDYDVENVSQFLIEHDPNYQKTDIGTFKSYITYYASWYLKKDIEPISKDKLQDYDVPNSKYKYIISQKKNLNNYNEIYHSGKVYLYENIG